MHLFYLGAYSVALLVALSGQAIGQTVAPAANFQQGMALVEEGRLAEARPLLEKAVQLQTGQARISGEFQMWLNELGNIYIYAGDQYREAMSVLHEAIVIGENAATGDTAELVRSLTYMATVYWDTVNSENGPVSEAEQLFLKAIDVGENQLGPDHSALALPVSMLGAFYSGRNRCDEARKLLDRSLQLIDHGKGTSRTERGKVHARLHLHFHLCSENKYNGDVEAQMEAEMVEAEKYLPAAHPVMTGVYIRMGYLMLEKNRYDDAESFMLRATSVGTKSMGPRWLIVNRARNDLRAVYSKGQDFYKSQGKLEEAERYQQLLDAVDPYGAMPSVKR